MSFEPAMNLSCPEAWWVLNDFSECFTTKILGLAVPAVLVAASVLFLLLPLLPRPFAVRKVSALSADGAGSKKLRNKLLDRLGKENDMLKSFPAQFRGDIAQSEAYSDNPDSPAPSSSNETLEAGNQPQAKNGTIQLESRYKHASFPVPVTVVPNYPRYQRSVVWVEAFLVLTMLALSVSQIEAVLAGSQSRAAYLGAVTRSALWVYLLAILALRQVTSRTAISVRLWGHSIVAYFVFTIITFFAFRTAYFYSDRSDLAASSSQFASTLGLFLLLFLQRPGNKVVYEPLEDDISPCPESTASLASLVFFNWTKPIMAIGSVKTVEMEHVWNIIGSDSMGIVMNNYPELAKTIRLAFHLFAQFKRPILLQGLFGAVVGTSALFPSLVLKLVLQFIENRANYSINTGFLFLSLFIISEITHTLADAQSLWLGRKLSLRFTNFLVGKLYTKALQVGIYRNPHDPSHRPDPVPSHGSRQIEREESDPKLRIPSSGEFTSAFSVDCQNVANICYQFHTLWVTVPLQIVMISILLYYMLGPSAVIGISSMAIFGTINMYIMKKMGNELEAVTNASSERISTTSEIIEMVRSIKISAMNKVFLQKIDEKREKELSSLKRWFWWVCCNDYVWDAMPSVITVFTIYSYTVFYGNQLLPSVVFPAISMFHILRIPLDLLAYIVTLMQAASISLTRIEELLSHKDTFKYDQIIEQFDESGDPIVGIKDATFTVGTSVDNTFTLKHINVKFMVGKFNLIIGSTGSGKSLLLKSLLGEVPLAAPKTGKIFLPGSRFARGEYPVDKKTGLANTVAYCDQVPWLQNTTVKENILFSSVYDEERYQAVVQACGLDADFPTLDHGDDTVVGDGGVSVSGGQKQRIDFARALYSNSRILILDDILSAVDSRTAKTMFDKALTGPLMKNRTMIMVSHASICLEKADFVVKLDGGKITYQGPVDLLPEEERPTQTPSTSVPVSQLATRAPSPVAGEVEEDEFAEEVVVERQQKTTGSNGKRCRVIVHHESKAVGRVDWSTIRLYLRSMGGPLFWVLIMTCYVVHNSLYMELSFWMRHYINESERAPVDNQPSAVYYLGVYGIIAFTGMALYFARDYGSYIGSWNASKKVHAAMVRSVMGASFTFFDKTPFGQIMNRFSKDVRAIDREIGMSVIVIVSITVYCSVVFVVIASVAPIFVFPALLLMYVYYRITAFYIPAARDLKRLNSIQNSPVVQHFKETTHGAVVIRAYGEALRSTHDLMSLIDTYNRAYMSLWSSNRWLSINVIISGSLLTASSAAIAILSGMDSGSAGIILSHVVSFGEALLWCIRTWADLEQNMNSMERIHDYIEEEQERVKETDCEPSDEWPSRGEIRFENYSTKYKADMRDVLHSLSLTIKSGSRFAVVGRTGAGKSSFVKAVLRALESTEGSIKIDGLDISNIKLESLRRKISVIPQDPAVFDDTLRFNLDPTGKVDDDAMKKAILDAGLSGEEGAAQTHKVFQDLNGHLDKGGNNVSQGQKQLISFLRAVLRKPKIMVMDEATSSMDLKTDDKIQEYARRMKCTMITVAHRLRTIIDYDTVLVLDKGEIAEIGSPFELISRESSIFHGMCQKTNEYEELFALAQKAEEENGERK